MFTFAPRLASTLLAASTIFLIPCRTPAPATPPPSAAPEAPPPSLPPPPSPAVATATTDEPVPDLDHVVVTVNGVPVTEREVLAEVDERIGIYAAESLQKGLIYDESSRTATRDFFRDEVLNVLIVRRLAAERLAADGIEITEADVDAAFEEKLRERGQTRAEAEAEIAEQGKTMAGVRTRIRWNNLAVRRLHEKHAPERRRFTEQEARAVYLARPDEFHQQHERRVSRILFVATSEHDAERHARARARAGEVLARLRAGEDFASLARAHCEDAITRARGGDRGWSPRGFVTAPGNDPFGDAAFALEKVGDMTGIVRTLDGYEIILLTGLREERRKSFEEVKDEIIAKREFLHIGEFWDRFAGGMKKNADLRWSPREIARREENARRDREFIAGNSAQPEPAAEPANHATPPTDFVRRRPAL